MSDRSLRTSRRLVGGHLTEVISPRSEHDHPEILALAARYRRAAVPGVVSIHSFRGDPDPVLILALPGDESWATLPPPLTRIPSVGAQTATALAQMHSRGVTHGAITREAIIVDPRGNPVLAGFAHESGPPEADVRALAGTIAEIVATLPTSAPAQERLAKRLAGVCQNTVDGKHPTASRLAEELAAAPQPEGRTVRRMAIGLALAIGLIGLVWGRYPDPTDTESALAPATVPVTGSTTLIPSSTTTSPPATTASIASLASPPPPSTTIAGPAPTLRHGGRTWSAGRAGDIVVVADWRCRGRPAVMAARPGTGEVFLWRDWPVGGSEAGERIGLVPSLTGFADPPIQDCNAVAVTTELGIEQIRPETTR